MISVKSGGWVAETEFTILSTNSLFHYVQAKPKTGRTHQIRQHLQESYRSILRWCKFEPVRQIRQDSAQHGGDHSVDKDGEDSGKDQHAADSLLIAGSDYGK